ncbi:hypothetical protein JF710_11910 [Mycobacterium intracellulare]|uniref:hypothetical protein n=1 Tax=Mycobacterium intracellulare TaxID=1767 RepID=UPI001CDADD7C|nr:hypothetical protein [Mycobacterium intracellulare]MCA2253875.1 hypothetical protein [Mycobacterium intracellulare]
MGVLPEYGKQPAWMDEDSPEREQRVRLEELLDQAISTFERLAQPDRDLRDDRMYMGSFVPKFDASSSRVLGAVCVALHELLYKAGQAIYDGDEMQARFLVEYVDPSRIREFAEFLNRCFDTLLGGYPEPKQFIDFLSKWIEEVKFDLLRNGMQGSSTSTSASIALDRWRGELESLENRFRQSVETAAAVDVIHEAAADATRARDAAVRAAGQTGVVVLGDHFKEIADREARTSFWWTIITIASVLAAVGVSALTVYRAIESRWIETLIHLAVVLPVIGLASYTARIARHHRDLVRWARTTQVLLNSVHAFAEQLEDSVPREQLILEFGRAIFTQPSFGEEKADQISVVPSDVLDTLKEVAKSLQKK